MKGEGQSDTSRKSQAASMPSDSPPPQLLGPATMCVWPPASRTIWPSGTALPPATDSSRAVTSDIMLTAEEEGGACPPSLHTERSGPLAAAAVA